MRAVWRGSRQVMWKTEALMAEFFPDNPRISGLRLGQKKPCSFLFCLAECSLWEPNTMYRVQPCWDHLNTRKPQPWCFLHPVWSLLSAYGPMRLQCVKVDTEGPARSHPWDSGHPATSSLVSWPQSQHAGSQPPCQLWQTARPFLLSILRASFFQWVLIFPFHSENFPPDSGMV